MLQCNLLFLKHLLLIRRLKIKELAFRDRIIIEGNEVELIWKVRGCYKIKINRIGTLPGHIHGLRFILFKADDPVEVIFYGISGKIRKRVPAKTIRIHLPDNFLRHANIPYVTRVSYNRETLINNIPFRGKIHLPSIDLAFEPFNIENFH